MTKKSKTLARGAISIMLMAFLLYRIDIEQVAGLLANLSWKLYFGPGLLLVVASCFVSTFKWKLLLNNLGIEKTYRNLLRYFYIGAFFNMFLPSTIGGDAVRIISLGREDRKYLRSAVSVVGGRLVGYFALLTIGTVSFVYNYDLFADTPLFYLLVLMVVANGAMAILFLFPGVAAPIVDGVCATARLIRLTVLAENVRKIHRGFAELRAGQRRIWSALLLSFVFQLISITAHVVVLMSLSLDIDIVYFFAIIPIAVTLVAMPLSLNGVGLREWVHVYLFGAVGLEGPEAVALSLGVFFLVVLNSCIGGIVYMWKGHELPREMEENQQVG
ncbi:MAG: lysylphosphatidylglycerol synthase transmembrane domain-containing protein [Candidatus Hydrogenedentota bacterium]